MTHYQINRITKKQKRIVRAILMKGLDAFYYNDYDEVGNMCYQYNMTPVDVIACIQYVEVKMLGDMPTDFDYLVN
jgi:hypothetical protein